MCTSWGCLFGHFTEVLTGMDTHTERVCDKKRMLVTFIGPFGEFEINGAENMTVGGEKRG